jgi:type IV fimbrial biogenesis protein FimT
MRTTQHGFSLIELVVVISIVAILMALGAPSYKYVTTNNRIAAEINGLVGDLQFARGEAIKEGSTVTVCASTDGTTCAGAGTTTWTTGWIVFSDVNGNATVDASDVLMRMQKNITSGDTLISDNTISSITFNREGFARNLPGTVNIKVHDPTNNSKYTRCLNVTIVGALSAVVNGIGGCS